MARRAFRKHIKTCVSILTLSAIFTGAMASYLPVKEAAATENVTTSTKRNVMYYGDWSIWGGQGNFYPKDIPAEHLTHLNFAFLDFDKSGNLIFTDKDAAIGAPVGEPGVQWGGPNAGCINAFQELRAKNPNMKIGISVGGWSKSGDFSEVVANSSTRAKLVDNLVKYVEYANMDFVDIDWEYPAEKRDPDKVDNQQDEGTTMARPEDKENYIIFLEDLRAALDKKGVEIGKYYEVSVALPAPKSKIDSGIDVDRLFNVVDFANIMTYDMRGAWDETSGHQTGLYTNPLDPTLGAGLSVDESVNYLIEQGAEPEKIVVGAAYYTRGWNEVAPGPDANNPGLFGEASLSFKDADQTPSRGAVNEAPMKVGEAGRAGGVWSYNKLDELKKKFPGLKEYWDDTAKAPYLYDAETGKFFTYDNQKSIQEKTKYVNEKDLGGMIAWMASQDAASTPGSAKRDELTKATKEGLYGNDVLPDHEIVYADLDIECSIKPVKSEWGGAGGGYEITIKNNEKLQESDQVLKELERSAETIKTPILYIDSNVKLTAGDHMAGNISYEDGKTVIDIKGVWEGKNIEPGQSYKFQLSAPTAPEDLSDINSISVAQRMNENGTVIAKQLVYGDETINPDQNTAPVLSGITDKTISVGDKFDPAAGVKALDKEDGDLTSKIQISGSVDTQKEGVYTLTYSVTDSKGLTTEKTRTIIVKKEVAPPVENSKPVLHGITDTEIKIGEAFNDKAGITATDKEDGDLTSKIQVAGKVDTAKAGTYTLTYSVTDSEGATISKTRKVTVIDNSTNPSDDFDINKIYNAGDIVTYKGQQYKVKWWTQGAYPDKSDAFELIVEANPDGSTPYVPGKAYNGGDRVSHNGETFKAKWWTNTTPGSDSSWEKL